jgi:hypothetical protein
MDNDNPGTPRPVRCRSRGKGLVESPIEGRFARRVAVPECTHPLLPEPEMAQDALDDISSSMSETMDIPLVVKAFTATFASGNI